jgi:UDP:flavonoid glycosyltransferase YjiC (YdhE family)
MSAVAKACKGMDVEVVFIRPAGRAPDHVRTVDWVPLPAVLPHCAGVVHHGGAGTTLAALHAGVPQVIVQGAGDRRHNAGLVAARGAGLAVDPRDVTAAALARLVSDETLARQAFEVRDEIAAMAPPDSLVPELERLVAR